MGLQFYIHSKLLHAMGVGNYKIDFGQQGLQSDFLNMNWTEKSLRPNIKISTLKQNGPFRSLQDS